MFGKQVVRQNFLWLTTAFATLTFLTFLTAGDSHAQVIVDGEGFEPPAYSTTFPGGTGDGRLEGQLASLPGDGVQSAWRATFGTTSTAVVQTGVVNSGVQAVQLDRAANEAAGGGRWAVPVSGWPDDARFICIEWDMLVEDAAGPTGSFGPFFGVEAYDDDGIGFSNGLLGSMGVDATTGDVLYQAGGTGFFTETGSVVNFGEWNHFQIDLDYLLNQYSVILNGQILATELFVDGPGLDQFTDADIAAVAAAGDSISQSLTGTAYYDNFIVYQPAVKIPEPSTLALAATALVATPWLARRRRRRRAVKI